jgi:hypothetical protein
MMLFNVCNKSYNFDCGGTGTYIIYVFYLCLKKHKYKRFVLCMLRDLLFIIYYLLAKINAHSCSFINKSITSIIIF